MSRKSRKNDIKNSQTYGNHGINLTSLTDHLLQTNWHSSCPWSKLFPRVDSSSCYQGFSTLLANKANSKIEDVYCPQNPPHAYHSFVRPHPRSRTTTHQMWVWRSKSEQTPVQCRAWLLWFFMVLTQPCFPTLTAYEIIIQEPINPGLFVVKLEFFCRSFAPGCGKTFIELNEDKSPTFLPNFPLSTGVPFKWTCQRYFLPSWS